MEPSKGEDTVSVLFQAQYQHPESTAVCTWSYKGMRVVCFPGDAVLSQPLYPGLLPWKESHSSCLTLAFLFGDVLSGQP